MQRKKTMESDAVNHSNNFCHPAHDDQQLLQLHAAACSNNSIATCTAAAEIHGRYIKCILVRRTAAYNSVLLLQSIRSRYILCSESTHMVPDKTS